MIPYGPSTALVVVDVQNDFADPAGSLYVQRGEAVPVAANEQIATARRTGAFVVDSQDWHPAEIVAGLATDDRVTDTVLDARRLGFPVTVLCGAIRAVNLQPDAGPRAEQRMRGRGRRARVTQLRAEVWTGQAYRLSSGTAGSRTTGGR